MKNWQNPFTWAAYIKSLRLSTGISASLLSYSAFILAHQDTPWSIVISIGCICSATMAWNDYRDRENDRKKGKVFASNNPQPFLVFCLMLWTMACSISIYATYLYSFANTQLLWLGIFIGVTYSETRKLFLLPAVLVALATALPSMLAYKAEYQNGVLLLSFAIFLFIFARENIKDIEDKKIDTGYKNTLPQSVETHQVLVFVGFLVFMGALTTVFLFPFTATSFHFVALGFLITSGALFLLHIESKMNLAKNLLDLGILVLLLSILTK